ncbi:MAG: hypothetical protein GX267_09035 [Fibrobacter sp.]|jgi:predicted transposase/invertase (TIGR01784 family)|nr:hypothetical protein [Fibrobacter sp.]
MPLQNNNQHNINNAHDLFFRESMQDIEIAKPLALLSIPLSVQNCLDWETLETVKETWVDENLKEYRSDIIYRIKNLKNDQWVYLLFEHKSSSDKEVQFQLLSYIVEIWKQHRKQKVAGRLLPFVIPIVISNCNGVCNFDNSVKEMVAIIEEGKEVVPDFHFYKLDLCFFDPEKIEDGKLKIFLLALKYSRNPDLWRVLPWIIRRSEELQKDQKWQYDYLKVVLLYLMSVIKKKQIHRFKEIVSKEHSEGMGYMETIADAFREEERLKREKAERIVAELRKEIKLKDSELEKRESIIEQKDTELEKKDERLVKTEEQIYQMVRRMLGKGLDFQFISEITGLSREKIEKIQKTEN